MMKIAKLVDNVFADSERSIEDLTAGFLHHAGLLPAAPDPAGLLTRHRADTQALAERLMVLATAVGTGQATQQTGRTLSADEHTSALRRVRANAAALDSDYLVPDAAERARLRQLLYPAGLGAFTEAPLKVLPTLLRVYLDAVQDPANRLPAAFAERTVAELTPFAAARTVQAQQQQATTQARDQRRQLLPALEEQLTRNLHALCVLHEADRGPVASYFAAQYFEG